MNIFNGRRWPQRPSRRRPRVVLGLECLEDRTVPSTITITPTGVGAIASAEGAAFNGTVATFTDSNPAAIPSYFSAVVNWGDGTSSPADGQAVHVVADP